MSHITQRPKAEKIAVFTFGVVFLLLMLGIVLKFPQPTPIQYLTFRIILSLAAAGFAAMLPGALHLQLPLIVKGTVQAGGAIAVFVLVYTTNPAVLQSLGVQIPKVDATPIVSKFLSLNDAGDYESACKLYLTVEQQMVPPARCAQISSSMMANLGAVESRRGPTNVVAAPIQSGQPQDMGFVYLTKFHNFPVPLHETVYVEVEGKEWRIKGYLVQ
ncbi:DUF4019 domain-containing protein [Dyella acidiphila]|uniref:DUF4019 domain-containing protein n=1 Tax=Dyella acidiphila TaxID=2775866 RepID=A0ABR9GG62_9GAMM|nr:DUF4019 domain-containing protein [Dyella acidiphila]MBE1163037.1 hypothetical protein [Dyella acidiphila]